MRMRTQKDDWNRMILIISDIYIRIHIHFNMEHVTSAHIQNLKYSSYSYLSYNTYDYSP